MVKPGHEQDVGWFDPHRKPSRAIRVSINDSKPIVIEDVRNTSASVPLQRWNSRLSITSVGERRVLSLEDCGPSLLFDEVPGSGADRWSVDTWLVRTGTFFSKKGLISEMVSCGAWARAGPIRAHMGPYGPLWAQKGPV